MGIKGLAKLLSDEAPDCIREISLSSLQGRRIAVDASMAIYQFLIAVRSGGPNNAAAMLTNAEGETTSHIQGLFNRTIRFLSEGIRPVYIFDGKPPSFKSGELAKRREKREKAEKELEAAKEEGNVEEEEKQSKRLVRAGKKENEDCMKLLNLMGVPVIQAPCEAEAQASALAQKGVVYAVGTEDMDALTFKAPVLLRKMTFANAKTEIQSMNYDKALAGLELSHDQFVDLCILLGCDYCDSIRGIGPKTALKLIKEHGCIEKILDKIDKKKYGVPDSWIPNEIRKQKKMQAQKKKEEEEYNTDDEKKGNAANEPNSDDEKKGNTENEPNTDDEKKGNTENEPNTDDEKKGNTENEPNTDDEKKGNTENEPNTDDEKKGNAENVPNSDDEKKGNTENEPVEEDEEELIPIYVQARKLFNHHEVNIDVELKWEPCKPDELTKFLVDEMGFSADRVKSNIERLQKAFKATAKPQTRMDSFFKVKPAPNAAAMAGKRKAKKELEKSQAKKGKKGSAGFFGKRR